MKLKLNQTLIKMLKKGGECPRYINDVMLNPISIIAGVNVVSEPSDAMNKGHVFESIILGIGNPEVPKLKSGGTPADYTRIQEQAFRFLSELIPEYELDIEDKNKQLYLETQYSEDVILHGTIDFLSPIKDDVLGKVPMAIQDLKMTGSIFKQFGDYSWAFPYNIDHTQAHMYKRLVKDNLKWDMPFYYWVFDWSPDKNFKIFRKETNEMDKRELDESIRISVERLNHYDKNGWVEFPSPDNCKGCPLKNACKSYTQKQLIEVI